MSTEAIHYKISFEDTIADLREEVKRWFAGPRRRPPDIDRFAEPVYFKSSNAIIVHANQAYRDFFARGKSTTGRIATTFLDNSIVSISEHTDALILAGVKHIRFDHECLGPNGNWFQIESMKLSLIDYNDGAFDILGVSRPVSMESETASSCDSLSDKHLGYKKLTLRDRRICQLLAEGRATKEIASIVDVTSKTVENRRRKIIEKLELEQPIDIVKMLVRFEERGFEI
jgi:DNA-binding CsgD family transcriptional regulator